MLKSIRWSSFADADFANLLEYLESDWNNKIALDFIENLNNCINQIQKNPNQFPFINKNIKIRKCVITKHNTLYYRVNKDKIDILRIYDTRQNPSNAFYRLPY